MGTSNVIPAMSPGVVHDYLRELGRGWSGQGVAMEVGCWLGATSVPLLEGLVEAGYNKPFWAFDRWRANASEVMKAKAQGQKISFHQDLQNIYLRNVHSVYDNIIAIKGRIPNTFRSYRPEPIELCMFDAPKREPVFGVAVRKLVPHFIPGVTVFGLLDYYFYERRKNMGFKDWEEFLSPVKFVNDYSDCFTLLREFPESGSCAFFKYEKQISWK